MRKLVNYLTVALIGWKEIKYDSELWRWYSVELYLEFKLQKENVIFCMT